MSNAVDSRVFVLSEKSGLFFVGPDAPAPWLDDPLQAMQFSSASEAWRYAKDLEQPQGVFLQGDPVILEALDRESGEALRIAPADTPYALLRSSWRRVLGEPLPLDMPDAPDSPELARERLADFLNDTNWDEVRSRGGDSPGFDQSFRVAADMLREADPEGFRNLWSSVVPPDIGPPLFSVGDPNEVSSPFGSDIAASSDLPSYVTRHFAGSRGSFYYRQRPDVLAFSVRGDSFRAADNSVMTATAIIEMAQARGWSRLRVRGAAEFRRAVWTAASERGIAVLGYTPTRGEIAVLAQSASPDGHPSRSSSGSKKSASGRSSEPSLTGVVVDMGAAPYQHERSNSDSFFVTLQASDGQEHTHWGVGLQKAIERASVGRGDRVSLERQGKESVEVDRPVLDAKGDVSYKKTEVVERRVWGVRVLDQTRDASPGAVDTQIPAGASADPEVAKALALIEKRLPQLPEAARQELRQHFDAAYERLSKSPRPEPPARDRSSKSVSRSARGR